MGRRSSRREQAEVVNEWDKSKRIWLKETEESVIGTVLCYPDEWRTISNLPSDFFLGRRASAMYAIIRNLANQEKGWSMAVMLDILKSKVKEGEKELFGDYAEMRSWGIVNRPETLLAELPHLKEAYVMRKLQAHGAELKTGWSPGMSVSDVLAPTKATFELFEEFLAQSENVTALDAAAKILARLRSEDVISHGVKIGMPSFDTATGGIMQQKIYIVGARPSTGKTAFGVTVANDYARRGGNVLFLSLEDTEEGLGTRLIANQDPSGKLDAFHIKTGRADGGLVAEMASKLPTGIEIVDSSITIDVMSSKIREWRRRTPGRDLLVVLDYLEYVKAPGRLSREQQLSEILLEIQRLAKDEAIAFLVLSQLNRAAQERTHGPVMEDFRYSGMIEQVADVALMMWKGNDLTASKVEVNMKLAKNRVGGIDRITWLTHLVKPANRFMEIIRTPTGF